MAPRNSIATEVSRERYNPVLIDRDLEQIVAAEGPLTRNHLLDGSHILRAFNVFLTERLKPETIEALNHSPSDYYLAWSAFIERARYERRVQRNNKRNREAQKPAESTTND